MPVKADFLDRREELIRELSNERISWVKPVNYHVTIRFLGDTPTEDVSLIRNALAEAEPLPPPVELRFLNLGSFGPRKKPRVIWAGFNNPDIFAELRKSTDRALASCAYRVADEPLKAHLTLGRIRSLKDPRHFYEVLEQMKDHFSGEIVVDRLVFYRSILRGDGPVYEPLLEIPLNPSGYR